VDTPIFQGINPSVYSSKNDRNAADLNSLNLIFLKLLAEDSGIPMVDESPLCLLIGFILALRLRVV
jgi:hypothetical protein